MIKFVTNVFKNLTLTDNQEIAHQELLDFLKANGWVCWPEIGRTYITARKNDSPNLLIALNRKSPKPKNIEQLKLQPSVEHNMDKKGSDIKIPVLKCVILRSTEHRTYLHNGIYIVYCSSLKNITRKVNK